MVPKTEDQFRAELEDARHKLEQHDRHVDVADRSSDNARLACDFDLPYSSLPSLGKQRWN